MNRQFSLFSDFHKYFSPTDYVFLGNKLIPLVKDCDYQAIVISDHALLTLKLTFLCTQPEYFPWCLNHLLFSDEQLVFFLEIQIYLLLDINQTPRKSCSTLWESMKA